MRAQFSVLLESPWPLTWSAFASGQKLITWVKENKDFFWAGGSYVLQIFPKMFRLFWIKILL